MMWGKSFSFSELWVSKLCYNSYNHGKMQPPAKALLERLGALSCSLDLMLLALDNALDLMSLGPVSTLSALNLKPGGP